MKGRSTSSDRSGSLQPPAAARAAAPTSGTSAAVAAPAAANPNAKCRTIVEKWTADAAHQRPRSTWRRGDHAPERQIGQRRAAHRKRAEKHHLEDRAGEKARPPVSEDEPREETAAYRLGNEESHVRAMIEGERAADDGYGENGSLEWRHVIRPAC